MSQGNDMTAITYAKADFPKMDYEVAFEAKRIRGNDFFCHDHVSGRQGPLLARRGRLGRGVVGLSNIDDKDASENRNQQPQEFRARTSGIASRIRVTSGRIAAWIDDKQVVNFATKGRQDFHSARMRFMQAVRHRDLADGRGGARHPCADSRLR